MLISLQYPYILGTGSLDILSADITLYSLSIRWAPGKRLPNGFDLSTKLLEFDFKRYVGFD